MTEFSRCLARGVRTFELSFTRFIACSRIPSYITHACGANPINLLLSLWPGSLKHPRNAAGGSNSPLYCSLYAGALKYWLQNAWGLSCLRTQNGHFSDWKTILKYFPLGEVQMETTLLWPKPSSVRTFSSASHDCWNFFSIWSY